MRLVDFQADFENMMVNPDQPPPVGIVQDLAVKERMDVYRNNRMSSLVSGLGDLYPVIKRLVGDEFFTGLAKIYTNQHPPLRGCLIGWGDQLAEFLENFEPAKPLPYLPDVARLEYAWHVAYHAEDMSPLRPEDLAQVTGFDSLKLPLMASATLLHSPYPIHKIWEANQEGASDDENVDLNEGEAFILVIRPRLDVEVRVLTPQIHHFLKALNDGESLSQALDKAGENFDLANIMADLLRGETFQRIRDLK